MVLKKGKKRRRALPVAEEDGCEDAQQILQPFAECCWEVCIEEILPRLPANQLQKLKTVCRNWSSTISTPNFVRLHLKIYNESRIQVVVKNGGRVIEYKFNINSEETKQLPCPPAIRRSKSSSILGSWDGLLCLYFEGSPRSILVYNPSTGKYFLPKLSLNDTKYYVSCSWFGHNPCSGEYVLVLDNRSSNFELIHSTSCSVDPHVYYFCFYERIGTLLHGALHWPARRNHRGDTLRRPVIYSYHLDDNKYLEISPPVQHQLVDFTLGVAQGCLFAILRRINAQVHAHVSCEFEMWIMKEYGVEESWMKYGNIQGLNYLGDLNCHKHIVPLGVFPNGDLILDVDRHMLMKYSFNDNKAKHLVRHECGDAVMCADSLVSPRIVGT